MEFGPEFWDKTWSRKYERYNRHHQEIWTAVLPFMSGNVVDLGCGPCVMYEGKQVSLVGVDQSAEGLAQARLHYPQGTYIQADARDTGLPAHQFDTVISCGLLDYFRDWEPVLKEMKRLSRGNIIATLLHGFNGHDWSNPPYPVLGRVGNWVIIHIPWQ